MVLIGEPQVCKFIFSPPDGAEAAHADSTCCDTLALFEEMFKRYFASNSFEPN